MKTIQSLLDKKLSSNLLFSVYMHDVSAIDKGVIKLSSTFHALVIFMGTSYIVSSLLKIASSIYCSQ